MKELFNKFFIGNNGKVSWTAIGAVHGILLFWTVYLQVFILGYTVSAALLTWSLEIILVFLGARAGQSTFSNIIEGVGSIRKKKEEVEPIIQPALRTIKKEVVKTSSTLPVKVTTPKPIVTTSNFSIEEFNSHDGAKMPAKVRNNVIKHIKNLEVIREACGNRAIIITSGYRSPEHNKAVEGEPNSQHLLGNAADIKVAGMTPAQVANVIEALMDSGKIEQGGIGRYKRFTHIDRRGTKVKWRK